MLMLAYRSGIFPMADSRDDPEVFWVEPRHRAVLPLDQFHCARSLARTLRRGRFTVTCNTAFNAVLDACAGPRPAPKGQEDDPETWISHRIAASYRQLHANGFAHSIECWQDGKLAGGLYGVGFDRAFCGESMFSRVPDASKVALAWLVAALRLGGAELLDCQFMTGHLGSLGAVEITQAAYLKKLSHAQRASMPTAKQHLPAGKSQRSGEPAAGAAAAGAGEAEAPSLGLPEAFAGLLALAKSAGFSSSPGNFIAQSLTHTS